MLYLITVLTFVIPAILFWLAAKLSGKFEFRWAYPCKAYLCILFFVVGLFGHIIAPEGVVSLMPEFIPFRTAISYITGVLELAFVVLLWTKYQRPTAWVIIVYLVITIPFNIYGWTLPENSPNYIDDPFYLWFRVPMQGVFIFFAYFGVYERMPWKYWKK
jgi:uncharacterized membrane protein